MENKPIRVLHILQRMESAGVQTLLMNIYRRIDRNKIQFDFLVHYKAPQFFDEEIKQMGGRIYRLSFREDFNIIKYCKDLNVFFNEHKDYKIIHAHMHSLGFIYLHYAKKYKIPVRIAHSHTNATQFDFKKPIKLLMNKLYSINANYLFACSKTAGEYMFRKKKFDVINNAIDSEKFKFDKFKRNLKRKELGLDDNNIVIGCVGRFEIQKNQKFSLQVFERFLLKNPTAKLIFIGSGSKENEVKKITKKQGLSNNVIFLGNRKDMPELFQAMDLFLFPSLFEGLGIVGIEAQAAGVPVLCNKNLPSELNVSPLITRLPLNENINVWAEEINKCINSKYAHTDTKKYIIEAQYDITSVVSKLEKFYCDKC